MPGWTNLDCRAGPNVDLVCHLGRDRVPLADDTVEEFLLSHVLEHIEQPLAALEELHRVARPGARLVARCPYGSSDDAWGDPTHLRPIYEESFLAFSQGYYWRADYGYRGDWRLEKLHLSLTRQCTGVTTSELLAKIRAQRNMVSEITAEMIAVKPIRDPLQEHLRGYELNLVRA